MNESNKSGFPAISDELFNTFFSMDKEVTEMIINTLLDTDFRIERLEPRSVDEEEFGFYHPYVVGDAHTSRGRCVLIMTPVGEDTEDIKSQLLYWMIHKTGRKRRNIYPVLISFDMTKEGKDRREAVTMSIIDEDYISCALTVVWMNVRSGEKNPKNDIISDLLSRKSEDIVNDDIRRIYNLSYEKSGLRERSDVAYSLWLDSVRNEIRSLGLDPESIMNHATKK